jgi:hypothetical protein
MSTYICLDDLFSYTYIVIESTLQSASLASRNWLPLPDPEARGPGVAATAGRCAAYAYLCAFTDLVRLSQLSRRALAL